MSPLRSSSAGVLSIIRNSCIRIPGFHNSHQPLSTTIRIQLSNSRNFTYTALKSLEQTADTTVEPLPSLARTADTPVEISPSPSKSDLPKLPYHVSRTHTNNLPVYIDIRSGGTRIETRIQKIHGNPHALLKDVSNALSLGEVKAYVKLPGGHVIFAGRHKEGIVDFLLKRGF